MTLLTIVDLGCQHESLFGYLFVQGMYRDWQVFSMHLTVITGRFNHSIIRSHNVCEVLFCCLHISDLVLG